MLFEEIMQKHERKEITILCGKLTKKFSFTRSSDVTLLCELAYRLYVVGDKESVLQICKYSNIDIPSKINFNIWDFMLWIWGLQAYIYEEDGRMEDRDFRILQMKKVWSTNTSEDETEEERWHFAQRILKRQDYNSVCKIDEIEKAEISEDKKRADNYRFHALYRMIGYGVTCFCPDLEENKLKLKEKINEYISCLR